MCKSLYQSILAYFVGSLIGFILTSLVFKLGWENKEHILVLGYGGLFSVVVFYVKYQNLLKQKDMNDLEEKIKAKADASDIRMIQTQIDSLHITLAHTNKSQEEMHATVDNIYKILLNSQMKSN